MSHDFVDAMLTKTKAGELRSPVSETLGMQLVEIGNAFGGRDHSTVIHSLERVETLIHQDATFNGRVESLRKTLSDLHS